MAISRMQEPRQLQANGGIMTLQDPRQGYFLGKLVKKAVRGVKKIVKSPLGKAALGIGLGMYAGGLGPFGAGGSLSGIRGAGFLKGILPAAAAGGDRLAFNAARTAGSSPFSKIGGFLSSMNPFGKNFSGRNLFMGLGATAVATPLIQKALKMGPYQEVEEEVENFIDPQTAFMMARYRDPSMAFLPRPEYVQEGFYLPPPQSAADGGRIGYANGEMVGDEMQLPPEAEKFLRGEYQKYVAQGGDMSYEEFKQLVLQQAAGEQGPEDEEIMTTEAETIKTEPEGIMMMAGGGAVPGSTVPGYTTPAGYNKFDYRTGGVPVRVGAQEGGLMDLGGLEKDYREGGFVPIGKEEKADDVPARLSVNEFVFTADAVRNAGEGDIDKGAKVMENMMQHLESGGTISKESQGLEGAQEMYDNMRQLETRVI